MNYISLFSSAGVGCYGFQKENYDCIATVEMLPRRMAIQRYNNKCKYDTGYICGDITKKDIHNQIFEQIKLWNEPVDVVIATPPCQGMSVANLKKKADKELIRNSLVVEAIKLIKSIQPKFFIFENVPTFLKTICTDTDHLDKPIGQAIEENLAQEYIYEARTLNFVNYGNNSSRTRTLVIGVSRSYSTKIKPASLFPQETKAKTVREVIGYLPALHTFEEISATDIYHSFRPYAPQMREWISCLNEGESAFDNEDDLKKPHKVVDGKIVIHQQKSHDKYKRQFWDKPAFCVHTRMDTLSSQNTIHPQDDRVFSIRELMLLMTIPEDFKWCEQSLEELNALPVEEKKKYLRKEAPTIRKAIGEAVPTSIFQQIARNIKGQSSLLLNN